MNQKRNRLFAIALCGSLLISSLNGIPAVAETINAPNITQEKPQEEPQTDAPPESSESGAPLRGLPVIPPITKTAAEAQPEEPPVAEVSENVQLDQPVPLMTDPQQGSKRENRAGTVAVPAKTYKLAFIDEAGNYIDPAKVTITGDVMKVEAQGTSGKVGDVVTSNVGNLKEMTVPTVPLVDDDSTGNTGYSGIWNNQIRLPGYYDLPQISPTSYHTGTTFPIAQSKRVSFPNNEVTEIDESGIRFKMARTTPKQYEFQKNNWNSDVSKTKFAFGFNMATTSGVNAYYTTDDTVYYYVPNRRVSIYYSTMALGALPAYPTGYNASLSKTVVDSDNFHYKAPKAFPATYSSGGRHFQFKGWYKGPVRPADPKAVKLETSLTPEFDVTYDGADNLYVFYDEVKEMTTTIPEVTYKFGFVDEKGALVAPTNVDIQANLTTVTDNVAQKVGTATGANAGNLKQLTVPSQTLTHVPKIKVASSGVTDFRLTIPKRYKIPTVTPGSFYTGSTTAYPLATTLLRHISGQADERITTDGTRYSLYNLPTPHSYYMYRSSWQSDVTSTGFSATLSMATTEIYPAYFTTDNTMYYFLENRRVTEHYVDEAGAEVPVPTGFTQGNQTVIDSDTYHFKLAKELPFSYFLNNKAYRFKGWYKGKTKPKVLETSRTPEYDTTFDDNDDLTVVYEEIKYGGNAVTFGFVGEDG